INIGNIEKDAENVKEALAAYDSGAKAAQRCGRRDLEADASRLRAGVLNDIDASSRSVPDRHKQAVVFAQHAIGLLRVSIYHGGLARSLLELGDDEEELGSNRAAAEAYFEAERVFQRVPDEDGRATAFVLGSRCALDHDAEFYLKVMSAALNVTLASDRTIA